MDVVKGGVQEAAAKLESLLAPKDTQEPESEPTETSEPVASVEAEGDVTEPESPEAEAPEAEPQTYTVKVDGQEESVTLDELLKGYSRTSYFHKKLSELDRERKDLEGQIGEIQAERARLSQLLPELQAELEKGEQEPDWDKLFNEDPIEFVRQEALWRTKKEKRERLLQEQRRLNEAKQAEFQRVVAQKVKEENSRLLEALPEWKNGDTASAEKAKLLEYGLGMGYSEQELSQLYDHRAVLLLHKARLYDEGQSKVRNLQAKPTPVKPAKAGNIPSQRNTGFDKAKKQFSNQPTVRNAAAAIERLISR